MVLVQLTVCRVMVDFPDHVSRLLIDDVLLHEEVLRRRISDVVRRAATAGKVRERMLSLAAAQKQGGSARARRSANMSRSMFESMASR